MTTSRRDLRLLCVGAGVSQTGSALTAVALALHLRSHGPIIVAALLIASLAPAALGAPAAGWLVDHLPNRRILLIAQFSQAVLTLGLVVVVDDLSVAFPLLVLAGCANAVTMPAAMSLLPHITRPDDVHRGYSWLSAARAVGYLAGSSLAGVLVAGPGVRAALLLDASSFVVLGVLLLLLRGDRDPRRPAAEPGAPEIGLALDGVRYLRRDPILSASLIGFGVAITLGVLVNVAAVYLITDTLGAGDIAFGLIAAVWDVGMVAGSWLSSRFRAERSLIVNLPLANVVMGVAILGAGVAPNVWVVALSFFIGGISNGMSVVFCQSLLRARSPEVLRGRIFAAGSALMTMSSVLGTVLSGPAVALLGPRWSLGGAGPLIMLTAVGSLVVAYRFVGREPRPAAPAAEGAHPG